jgi:uncharacterized membrane protein YfcA
MAFFEENLRSIRIWFGLAGTLQFLGGLALVLGPDQPRSVTLLNAPIPILGAALLYCALKLPELMKREERIPEYVLGAVVIYRLAITVLNLVGGVASERAGAGFGFFVLIAWYLWTNLKKLRAAATAETAAT